MFKILGNLLRANVTQKQYNPVPSTPRAGGSLLRHDSAFSARNSHVPWPWSIGLGKTFFLLMAIWREFRVQGFEKRVREVDQTKAAHTAHGTVPGPAAGGSRQLHEAIPEGVHAGCQEQRWRGQVDVSANRAGPPSSTMMPMSLKQKLMSAYRASRRLRHPTVAGRQFFQDKLIEHHDDFAIPL